MHVVCVCNYISSKKIKHKRLYLWRACPLRSWKGLWSSTLITLTTLTKKPQLWFVYEISQSKYGNPYNLSLWLFRDKTTTHIDFSQQNRTYRSTMTFYITMRYVKNKSWSLQSLVEQSLPENKVSILSKTRKGEMNQVRLKQAFAY